MVEEQSAQCPYCWEQIILEIDPSYDVQEYVEDCQVCCHPILIRINITVGGINIQTAKEDDGFY